MSHSTRDRVRGLFRRKKTAEAVQPESEASQASSPVLNSPDFIGLRPEGQNIWESNPDDSVSRPPAPRRTASYDQNDLGSNGQSNWRADDPIDFSVSDKQSTIPSLTVGPGHRRIVSEDNRLHVREQIRGHFDAGPPFSPRDPSSFEFGVDPSVDPELALALKLSLEEETARIAKQNEAIWVPSASSSLAPTPYAGTPVRTTSPLPGPIKRKPVAGAKGELTSFHARLPDLASSSQYIPQPRHTDSKPFEPVLAFDLVVEPPAETDTESLLDDPYYTALDYTYEPLKDDDIRLLVLRPKQKSRLIECDIIHVSLRGQEFPEYEALSYCWGKHSVQKEIIVGGRQMLVGENLWVALRNLRAAGAGKERLLWVDAISINQSDIEERSIQVLRMGSIYQHAKRVVISLGGSPLEERPHYMWEVQTVQEHANAHMGCAMSAIKAGTAGIVDVGSHYFPCNNIQDLPEWSSPCFGTSLSILLSSPWFKRRWVIQELAFSKEALIQWGSHQVPWDNLVDFVTWAEEYKDQIQFGERTALSETPGFMSIDRVPLVGRLNLRQEGQGAGITIKKIEGLIFASRRMVQKARHTSKLEKAYGLYPLDTLVTRFAAFNVTDPRDIVYSLLAFAQDRENWRPDYEKTVHEVFVEFFQYAVRKTSRLDIICFPWARMYGKTLPTWIKPWLGGPTRPLFAEFVEPVFEEALLQIDTLHMYSAAGSTVAREVEFQSNGTYVLRASGIWVGIVCLRARPMSPDVTVHYTEQFKEWYSAAVTWHMNEARSSSSQSNVRRRPPREQAKQSGKRLTPSQLGSIRDSFFKVAVAGKYSSEHTPHTDRVLFKKGLKESDLGITACSPLFQRIRPACYDRRLIWTDTGKLGLVPRNAEASDMICILFGCSVPIILRPKDERYVVIGECYVDGIMNGEAVLDYEMGKYQKMVFDIQ